MGQSPPPEWPNLFLVGVARGGTTSLWAYLDQHPDIHMSQVKEPHFFTDARPPLTKSYNTRAYLQFFAGAQQPVRGEASASYFGDSTSPPAIKRANPDAKILVILRDPVERAYSAYWHVVAYGGEKRSFVEAVKQELDGVHTPRIDPYVKRGFYSGPLRRYLDVFGENVHVLFLEEMNRDPATTLRSVFEFLGVDADVADRLVTERQNTFSLPRGRISSFVFRSARLRSLATPLVPFRFRARLERMLLSNDQKPPMAPGLRQLLENVYRADGAKLESMLRRPLPWS
jgi:hypothetical protein